MQLAREYVPYWEWEDWKNGMWHKSNDYDKDLQRAVDFTGNHIKYGNAMMEVISQWPRTMLNGLSNLSINRKAFIGHCAVSYKIGIPEHVVRDAWKLLTENQRVFANMEADKAIKKWERNQRSIRISKNGNQDVIKKGYQMKLQLK